MYLGDYPKALEYYHKTLEICEKNNDEPGIANAFTNLGLFYRRIKDYPKALENQEKALKIFERRGIKQGQAGCLSNIGVIYSEQNENPKAIKYFNDALTINEKLSSKQAIASNLANIGVSLTDMHQFSNALGYLKRALTIYEQVDSKDHVALIYNQIGKIYVNAPVEVLQQEGISESHRYLTAIRLLERSLLLSKETGSIEQQMNSWEILTTIYTNQKKNDQAFKAYKNFIQLRDSIMNDEKKQQIAKNEIEFQFQKKEAVIKTQHAAELSEQRIIQNAIVGGAGIFLVGSIISFLFYKRKRDATTLQKEAELRFQISDIEMKALRAQMNPHFIFNSLNSVGDYIAKNDRKMADEYLTKFARLIRLILENSERKQISLSQDLKALELYMQLEAIRLNNKFSYEIIVDNAIDVENTLVPPLILQPFIENSIWHGIAKKNGKGKITIHIKPEGEMITCIVEDDGVGRKNSNELTESVGDPNKKSLGMKITNARIDILNKVKKSAATVKLSDLQQGTRVEVKLPLELNF
jgi:tetratricopeptide (TPR) repeat protein